MKLRVRYVKKTRVIEVQDDPALTFSRLKAVIKENAFRDLGLSADDDFSLTLDGKTSIGEDETLLKDSGIVSGDLLKIVAGNLVPNNLSSQSATITQPSSSPAPDGLGTSSSGRTQSDMSVSYNEQTGEAEDIVDIPWTSPGPILFQDCASSSEVPHLLQQLYEDDSVKSEFQALCIALHFMICESGFYIEGHQDRKDILKLLDNRMFAVEYNHPAGDSLKFNFTCNQLGSFILMNGVAQPCQNTEEQVLTLQITTNDYIQSFKRAQKNSNASAVYKNLAKLAHRVKETIAYPALNNMREELRLPPVHGLLSLFPELLMRICSHLDFKSLLQVSKVSKRLQSVANEDSLWRNLYIRDFQGHPFTVDAPWKDMYAKRFVREKERKLEMERRYRDFQSDLWPQFPTPGFTPVPLPDQPFGIYGGDHDLHPSFPYGPFANQPRNPRHFQRPHPINPLSPDNPVPGSRYDPIYPGGGFRPGRGGGLMDTDFDGGLGGPMSGGFGGPPSLFGRRPAGGRNNNRFGFF